MATKTKKKISSKTLSKKPSKTKSTAKFWVVGAVVAVLALLVTGYAASAQETSKPNCETVELIETVRAPAYAAAKIDDYQGGAWHAFMAEGIAQGLFNEMISDVDRMQVYIGPMWDGAVQLVFFKDGCALGGALIKAEIYNKIKDRITVQN